MTCAAGKVSCLKFSSITSTPSCSCVFRAARLPPDRVCSGFYSPTFSFFHEACRVFNDQVYYTRREIRLPFHKVKKQLLLIGLFATRICGLTNSPLGLRAQRLAGPPTQAFLQLMPESLPLVNNHLALFIVYVFVSLLKTVLSNTGLHPRAWAFIENVHCLKCRSLG